MTLKVTCGLTAHTPGSALGSTLSNEYGKTLPFLHELLINIPVQYDDVSAGKDCIEPVLLALTSAAK